MNNHEFTMSLGIRHPDIDPAQITGALGLQPGHAWSKGEQRTSPTGAALGGSHRESYWFCEIVPRPKFSGELVSMESEMARVLQMLSKATDFLQGLHVGGGVTELFITIFARGDFRMELLPEQSALLGRIGLSLTIDVKSGRATSGEPT